MSEETAAERIVRRWREGPLEAMPENILLETAQRLQTDNERLRAREAALVAEREQWRELGRTLAQFEGAWVAERIGLLGVREQARALLAATPEPPDATAAE